MRERPIAVIGSGMVTGVGLTASASCAAIRCGIDNFQMTRYVAPGGEPILGCEVPLERPLRGRAKLMQMLAMALVDCLREQPGARLEDLPLLLCLADEDRPSREYSTADAVLSEAAATLGVSLHSDSRVIFHGRVGGAVAIRVARQLLHRQDNAHGQVIVAGVDSFLNGTVLTALAKRLRILTEANSNGFIPGEAAGAVLIGRAETKKDELQCLGVGFARERATIEADEPIRAEGLSKAILDALGEAGLSMADIDFRLTDVSGEQYSFKEASLALSRTLKVRKEEVDIWHPADCIGEVGAAALPCMLGLASMSFRKSYAPGSRIVCHLSNDDGKRAALILKGQQ